MAGQEITHYGAENLWDRDRRDKRDHTDGGKRDHTLWSRESVGQRWRDKRTHILEQRTCHTDGTEITQIEQEITQMGEEITQTGHSLFIEGLYNAINRTPQGFPLDPILHKTEITQMGQRAYRWDKRSHRWDPGQRSHIWDRDHTDGTEITQMEQRTCHTD